MKARPSILLAVVAMAAASLLLVVWSSRRPSRTDTKVTPQTQEPVENSRSSPPTLATIQPPSSSLDNEGRLLLVGMLEDQAGEPVGQAEILGADVSGNGPQKEKVQLSTRTDGRGLFRLQVAVGETVTLMPRKQGYALACTNNVASYSHLSAELDKPFILKMWKLQGPEPLATFSGHYSLPSIYTTAYFDFITQTFVTTNGDIKITINRPTGPIIPAQHPDWSVELDTTADGGLIETTAATWTTTYWAPTEGYNPKHVSLMSAHTPQQWSENASGYFFVQTRHGGVYSKLALKVGINLDPNQPLDLVLYGVSNTNGSCNWEADPYNATHE